MFVLNFIKKLITFEGENTFNVGDIIWAKRYKTQSEKERIKVGHQSSPYVIIKKKAGKIYALQSTSNPHLEVQWKMVYYPLGRLNYNLQKNSYLNCSREYEVEKEQILSKIGHLTDYDMNQIRKQIYILQKSDFSVKPNIEKKYLKYKVEAGDIILKGDRRYYIYFLDRKYFYCYRLRERIKINKNILIDNTYYSFVFKKIEKIKRNCKYDLVDTFNSGEIEIVNNYIRDEIQKLNAEPDNTSMIGALIKYDDKMYYIYEENETIAFVYRVYPYGDKIEDLFLEFDSHATTEARFAYQCDKLECDIQCKLYDQEGCVDLKQQEGNATADNELVKKLLENGQSWSDMWLEFGQRKYPYDKNFRAVSEYAKNNYIEEKITKKLIKKDK